MNERRPRAISIGEEHDEEMRSGAELERDAWIHRSGLPEHFTEVDEWLRQQVTTRTPFYREHKGLYVAVISIEPPVMEIHPDLSEVLERAYGRWGYRPVCTLKMEPSVLIPQRGPSPRAIRIR